MSVIEQLTEQDNSNAISKKRASRKKAKEEPVIVLKNTLDGNNVVQMAKTLYSQLKDLTVDLIDFKLIDVYFSKVNSHDVQTREVVYEKGELEALFGVERLRPEVLNNHLDRLLKIAVIVQKGGENENIETTEKNSFLLFDKAILEKDKKDGLWKVTMRCGEVASQLVFNIDKIGYLQHALRNTAKLKYIHSFRLLKFLESRRNNKGTYPQIIEIKFDELKKELNCDSEAYSEYKIFRRSVLIPAQKELTQKTDMQFDFEAIRKRSVVGLKFTIYERKKFLENEEMKALPENIPDISEEKEFDDNYGDTNLRYFYGNEFDKEHAEDNDDIFLIPQEDEDISFFASAMNNEFSPREVKAIMNFVISFFEDVEDGKKKMFKYLRDVYARLELQDISEKVENRFKYYCKIIQNDREGGKYSVINDFTN